MRPLEAVLAAREGRLRLRKGFAGPWALVHGGLNVPGWPKRLPGDLKVLRWAVGEALRGIGHRELWAGVDSLGAQVLVAAEADPLEVKARCAALEEALPFGRLLDLDVFAGSDPLRSLKRGQVGLPERRCLVCNRPAKECAVAARHHPGTLRRRALALWGLRGQVLDVDPPEPQGQQGAHRPPRQTPDHVGPVGPAGDHVGHEAPQGVSVGGDATDREDQDQEPQVHARSISRRVSPMRSAASVSSSGEHQE
ncbi:Phosphoribosyl-dephospho-CoA transferase (holo- ACP synthetase)-like protein [Thermanaerovibrio acidaminovorans DSM 6589]|uniref:citrate lyase holo-[acyl-carrier protein] synthase n=1 Tax=Thermanaerovibrio acidaminovorans (strain ATCC 49978 / DSM 6589 / Su883) TaxID=525903 RepID=D1B794_THEAS|nr:citrate lyase holo-[acyl-carrier protein] synthase [Thermanaerovibrio acidaminovorans]ACZ19885.1 Phosphoribosyl-dephospho-CoA transferase (holo- ACP synthetase)-like protein [Thermanaerovibrio acidaminovorans DSM 6589]